MMTHLFHFETLLGNGRAKRRRRAKSRQLAGMRRDYGFGTGFASELSARFLSDFFTDCKRREDQEHETAHAGRGLCRIPPVKPEA